jgi:hypothetical protein
MALEITGTIELDNGLSLSSIYGRTRYNVNDSSNKILIVVDYWIDDVDKQYAYNRAVDGVDVLDFTNQTIKAELEALGYSVVITDL